MTTVYEKLFTDNKFLDYKKQIYFVRIGDYDLSRHFKTLR